MQKTVILAAALGAMALGVPASVNAAAPGGAAIAGVSSETSLVQEVARRRVCTFHRGKRHCEWRGSNRHHGKKWRWRKNRHGVRVRIFL